MRQQQEEQKVNFGYYGPWAVWRDRSLEDIQAQLALGRPWVLRFRSTGSLEHKFLYKDLVKGELTITENDIDQVLLKSGRYPHLSLCPRRRRSPDEDHPRGPWR